MEDKYGVHKKKLDYQKQKKNIFGNRYLRSESVVLEKYSSTFCKLGHSVSVLVYDISVVCH